MVLNRLMSNRERERESQRAGERFTAKLKQVHSFNELYAKTNFG